MILTEEQLKKNSHIPVDVIQKDIEDTEKEIDRFNRELMILRETPLENKLRIYLLLGGITSREDFVENCKQCLEYNKKLNNKEEYK